MDLVADIKRTLHIEDVVAQYVTLKPVGHNFKAPCPFHSEKTPSFYVSVEKQIAYCFGCQRGGDVFQFIQEIESVDFPKALELLAERAGLKIEEYRRSGSGGGVRDVQVSRDEKQQIVDVYDRAAHFYEKQLWETPDGEKVLTYLRRRGISDETIRAWRLGFSPDQSSALFHDVVSTCSDRSILLKSGLFSSHDTGGETLVDRFRMRLMIPIDSMQGRVIAFGARALKKDMEPKYLNSPETVLYKKSDVLFGLSHAKQAIREHKRVILVEGYFDALACHQVGLTEAVATSGTALTSHHAVLLKRMTDTVYLCFDNDRAGWEATKRAFMVLQGSEMQVRVVAIADGKDPGDALMNSPERLIASVDQAKPFFEAYFDHVIPVGTSVTPDMISVVLSEALTFVGAIQNRVLKDIVVRDLAQRLGVKEASVYDELNRVHRPVTSLRGGAGVARGAVDGESEAMLSSRSDAPVPLQRLTPSERFLVGILYAPDPTTILSATLLESDFDAQTREIFVAFRETLTQGSALAVDAINERLSETARQCFNFYLLYGELLYRECARGVIEHDIAASLGKIIQNRRNLQLDAQKQVIQQFERDGNKSASLEALEKLRDSLKS